MQSKWTRGKRPAKELGTEVETFYDGNIFSLVNICLVCKVPILVRKDFVDFELEFNIEQDNYQFFKIIYFIFEVNTKNNTENYIKRRKIVPGAHGRFFIVCT